MMDLADVLWIMSAYFLRKLAMEDDTDP